MSVKNGGQAQAAEQRLQTRAVVAQHPAESSSTQSEHVEAGGDAGSEDLVDLTVYVYWGHIRAKGSRHSHG